MIEGMNNGESFNPQAKQGVGTLGVCEKQTWHEAPPPQLITDFVDAWSLVLNIEDLLNQGDVFAAKELVRVARSSPAGAKLDEKFSRLKPLMQMKANPHGA
jgi:hypothetical protein